MQYFSSLKFHDRWWLQIDSKAFSEVMKLHLTILTSSQRTQAQGREESRGKGCFSHISVGTQLGYINVLETRTNT